MASMSSEELKTWGESFEGKQPQEVLAAAVERYAPKIVLACSFGAEDVVLVDMVHRINHSVPLFYLDTEFLFPETYATRDRVIERYGESIVVDQQPQLNGKQLIFVIRSSGHAKAKDS